MATRTRRRVCGRPTAMASDSVGGPSGAQLPEAGMEPQPTQQQRRHSQHAEADAEDGEGGAATAAAAAAAAAAAGGGEVNVEHNNDDDGDEFHDIRIDDGASTSSSSAATIERPRSTSSNAAAAEADIDTGTDASRSNNTHHEPSTNSLDTHSVSPKSQLRPLGTTPPDSRRQSASASPETTPRTSARLSGGAAIAATSPAGDSASSSPSAPKRSFWGLLRTTAATTPSTPSHYSTGSASADSALTATPTPGTAPFSASSASAYSNASSVASFPSGAATSPMAVSSAASGRDSFASTASASSAGGGLSASSLAPSFFGAASTTPSTPGSAQHQQQQQQQQPVPALKAPAITSPPALPARKSSAFSPFASIMSNLRTRTSATSTTSSGAYDADDLDGRSRLPRRDLDEEKVAEEMMRFADARHILRTENDADELRQLGLRLEEAWKDKLAEVSSVRKRLESAQDTVSDLEDENTNLRTQLGLLSEQIAARESELEDFQRLTVGQIEAQRALWEDEAREERENLQFSLAQARREALEQKAINAQLRLVILGTLQGRLDGLTEWLSSQDEGGLNRRSKRMSVLIGKRRDSLRTMARNMESLAEQVGQGKLLADDEDASRHEDEATTPTADGEGDGASVAAAGMAASVLDEVSSTTSGKAGGSWSPKREAQDADGDEDDEASRSSKPANGGQGGNNDDDEEPLFDIEDVLFNLPVSPSVPGGLGPTNTTQGRRTTMLFNEPLNLEQLRKLGFFREPMGTGEPERGADGGVDGWLPIPATLGMRKDLSPTQFTLGSTPTPSTAEHTARSATTPTHDSNHAGAGAGAAKRASHRLSQHHYTHLHHTLTDKLEADNAFVEAARAENTLLTRRLAEAEARALELAGELEGTRMRLEQTEAALSGLFGEGEGEEDEEGEGEQGNGQAGHADGRTGGDGRKGDALGREQTVCT